MMSAVNFEMFRPIRCTALNVSVSSHWHR